MKSRGVMELARQVYGFVKRHRRVLMVGAGVTAVGVAAWKAKKILDEYKRMIQELDLARFEQHRLQLHMLRSRSECIPALLNFLQTLKKRVNEIVDITPSVKRLKSERDSLSAEEKQELWRLIMVSAFSRFFLAYYGFNLLNVVLRVQVHILGRYAFESTRREGERSQGDAFVPEDASKDALSSFSKEDRHRLLSLVYEFFLGSGFRQLKDHIQAVVTEELGQWSVHEKVRVSYNELYDALSRVRRRLEGPRGITTGAFPLLTYTVDMEAKSEDIRGTLSDMVNETWDAIESPSFKLAIEDCLDATFRVSLEDLHRTLYAAPPTLSPPTCGSHSSSASARPEWRAAASEDDVKEQTVVDSASSVEPPLAKVIAHMKTAASRICSPDPQVNYFIKATAENRSVDLLCSSFFEHT